MALKITSPPFTIFAPPPCGNRTSTTEVRFSRWNNANAQKFIEHKRSIKEIEDDIRITRRYESVSKMIENSTTNTITNGNSIATTKSIGTPSAPSRPSIPGRCSKYSKDPKPKSKYSDSDDDDYDDDSVLEENPKPVESNLEQNPNLPDDADDANPKQNDNRNLHLSHPAFRKASRVSNTKVPIVAQKHVTIGKNGVSYRIPNAPFEFQYSYTETPKVKPVALREPPFVPFGPTTMKRPWTGRAPLPGTKKKLPEFDSFRLPPPHKKGVKPVQAPGPFLAGSGPKYVSSREDILGEPLTKMERNELVQGSAKSKRQLNMGRDGLTHNMLENIHALWKRRRVCKIKCKGVCTVDMDNIFQQLEEKTGGKIIHNKGGVLYLFRGRNYNYMTRPRYPLMLWKPVTPVYPRLILQAPEGLTVEEANLMRKKGRKLLPICKLGKNGVYSHLVKHVREAFEECELVRINCQGMNASDYKKIAAKLKDLVPCVLLSFENEHILMWRGIDWTPTLTKLKKESEKLNDSEMPGEIISTSKNADSLPVEQQDASDLLTGELSNKDLCLGKLYTSVPLAGESTNMEGRDVLPYSASTDKPSEATDTNSIVIIANETSTLSDDMWTNDGDSKALSVLPMVTSESDSATILQRLGSTDDKSEAALASPRHFIGLVPASDTTLNHAELQVASEGSSSLTDCTKSSSACIGVLQLRDKAIETGNAVILDDASLDANIVYDRAVALAKVAPPGPIFMRNTPKKVLVKMSEKQESEDLNVEATIPPVSVTRSEKKSSRNLKIKHLKEVYPEIVPHGNLGVDELAKLLA